MSDGIVMETNLKGGLKKGIGRMFSGESLFMATYTSQRPGAHITLASSFPGTILALDLNGSKEYICQKDAFLCAEPDVVLSAHINNSVGAGFFGGEGFIMQKLSGSGMAFVEIDGDLVEYNLAPGQQLLVDTGNVAGFETSVSMEIRQVQGLKNKLLGGEGLFNTLLTGPGKVWLQTMPISNVANAMIEFIPTQG